MIFLGESQTFIGVLASLIVLCVLLDTGNFIHRILDEIKERIKEEIDKLDNATGFDSIDEVSYESDYKLLVRHIKELKSKEDSGSISYSEKEALSKAVNMELTLNMKFASLKAKASGSFLQPARNLLNEISLSREQVLAPCYALLSCLIVFFCDEIIVEFSQMSDFIVSFLIFFCVFSFIFWFTVWTLFLKGIQFVNALQSEEQQHNGNLVLKYFNWKITLLVFPIFYILCLLGSAFINIVWIHRLIAFVVGIIIPVLAMAFIKSKNHKRFGVYTYEFCFQHFLGLSIMALFFALITVLACYISISTRNICFSYQNLFALKVFFQILIFFLGLVCPFIIPYYGLKKVLKLVKKESINHEGSMKSDLEAIRNDLKEFCKNEIP